MEFCRAEGIRVLAAWGLDASRGTFSRDPFFCKTSGHPGKADPVLGKNDG